jgi:streptomycin 6-kinase
VDVPEGLLGQGRWQSEGEPGREWILSLPRLVEALAADWDLVTDGAAMHGYEGVVIPVRCGGQRYVLKLTPPGLDDKTCEALALTTWNGRGAVRLLRRSAERGAMLLERADSSKTLQHVELREAIAVAGGLLRVLAVPAPPGPPRLTEFASAARAGFQSRWEALGRPFDAALLRRVQDAADELAAAPDGGAASWNLLVNRDLHYGNVLKSDREPWLVIDPKVITGPVEYGVGQLLWTRLDEMGGEAGLRRCFSQLVQAADLDEPLARVCALVSCTDYWLWALGAGLTSDPEYCRSIVGTFLEL